MVLKSTFDYISQPLDTVDITMLRNTAVCGITALLLVVFGLSKLLILIFYLLVIGIVVTVTWLYSLEPRKRTMVIECIKEVLNSFMQKCMDEAVNSEKNTKQDKKTSPNNGQQDDVKINKNQSKKSEHKNGDEAQMMFNDLFA